MLMLLSTKIDGPSNNKDLSGKERDSLERGDYFIEVARAGNYVGLLALFIAYGWSFQCESGKVRFVHQLRGSARSHSSSTVQICRVFCTSDASNSLLNIEKLGLTHSVTFGT